MTHPLVAKRTLTSSQLELVQHISEQVYPQAVAHLKKILPYEKQLEANNSADVWIEYAHFEKANKQRALFLY